MLRYWLALLAGVSAAQQVTFRAGVDVVNILCSVHDRQGRPVAGLDREDFLVADEGQPQPIRYFARESLPLSIGMVVDVSGSMRSLIQTEKRAVTEFFLRVLRPQDIAFLMSFDDDVRLLQDAVNPGNNYKAIQAWLEKLSPRQILRPGSARVRRPEPPHHIPLLLHLSSRDGSCCTRLFDALYSGSTALRRHSGRKVLILVTDGIDEGSRSDIEAALRAAQDSDVVVYVLQYLDYDSFFRGAARDRSIQRASLNLNRMAEETGGRLFAIDTDHAVPAVLDQIQQEMRMQYSLGYTPPPDAGNSVFRRISVTTRRPALEVRARSGYYPARAASETPAHSGVHVDPQPAPITSLAPSLWAGPRPVCEIQFSNSACPAPEDELGGFPALPLAKLDRLWMRPGVVGALPKRIEDLPAGQLLLAVTRAYGAAKSLALEAIWSYRELGGKHSGTARIAFEHQRGRGRRIRVESEETGTYNRAMYTAAFEFIDDGSARWLYLPRENRYGRAAGEGAAIDAVSVALEERYTSFANFAPDARIVGRGTVKLGNRNVRCTVVRGRGPVPGMTEEYWIDEDSHMVVSHRVRDGKERIAGTLTLTAARVNEPGRPEAFRFQPPAGARRADSLALPEPLSAGARFSPPEPMETVLRARPRVQFTLKTADGKVTRLEDLRDRVVMLGFWEPWCPASMDERQKWDELRGAGLTVFQVTAGGTAPDPRLTIPDAARSVRAAFRVSAFPATVILDREGRMAGYLVGAHSREKLAAALRSAGRGAGGR